MLWKQYGKQFLASKASFYSRNVQQRYQISTRSSFQELTANTDAIQLEFMKEMVIQVDENDHILGPISKKDSHFHDGVLHRAFSLFLFNSKNQLLLQQRANAKITFPNCWANTCCSHPLYIATEMEDIIGVKRAAIRKIEQELGIVSKSLDVKDIKYVSTILYKAASDSNWTEHEMDHILFAKGDFHVVMNPNEVQKIEYIDKNQLNDILSNSKYQLSPWFRLIATDLLPLWWEKVDVILNQEEKQFEIHRY